MMKKTYLLSIVLLLAFAGPINQLTAQTANPSIQNIGSLNVDELSDDQIKTFVQKVEASGYTEDQLILMARSKGMSQIQIQKLRARMLAVRGNSKNSNSNQDFNRLRNSPTNEEEDKSENTEFAFDPFASITGDSTEIDDGLKIFGLNFFENAELSFETGLNMPTPKNYVIGAGDEIIIDIWGASEQTYQLTVSPEGAIRIPSLGPVYITGLPIDIAKDKVISRLKRIYSTIGKSSSADITLGQVRSINVHVIGEVTKPGTYTLSSFSTAFNALYNAGGPSENGSLRKIEIFRNQELISTLDAYDFLVNGLGKNITLQDQDMVIIRAYENRVSLDGEIKNPSLFELLDGETMADLLTYAGGFTENAYKGTINIRRIEGNFKTIKSVEVDSIDSFKLISGDEIFVSKVSNEFKGRVTIEGPVLNPGEYELTTNLRLSELLIKADGFRGDIFMERAVIIRQNSNFSLSNLAFNPHEILEGAEDIVLANNDIIKFQSIYDMREEHSLQIEGQILNPGSFAYVEGLTVENLIYLAGGFKEAAAKSFVEVARRINPDSVNDSNKSAEIFNFSISKDLKLNDTDSKFTLLPFDLVVIRKSPYYQEQEIIEIEGEAKYPGVYSLEKKDERISSVVLRAGNITQYAYPKGATLIRRTEYHTETRDATDNEINDAARIRKEDLARIFKKDTIFSNESDIFRQQEFIGIDLEKIMEQPGSKYDLILKKGDIISVPREFQTVRVRGEVLYPSNIRQDDSFRFKQYIAQAGGFHEQANKSKSYVIYMNGSSARTKNFMFFKNYPKIEPGSEIVIPKKEDKVRMSAQAWVALASSIGTLALVIDRLVN